jgi:hypothetical protein
MDRYKYDGDKSIFITEKNIHKISFIDPNIKTLVETMEKVKPEIFEEDLEINTKNKIISEIDTNRLVKTGEHIKAGVKKYTLDELKMFVSKLKLNVSNKKTNDLIDAIRDVIFSKDEDDE